MLCAVELALGPALFAVVESTLTTPLAFGAFAVVRDFVDVAAWGSGSDTLSTRFIWFVMPSIPDSGEACVSACFALAVVRVLRVVRTGAASCSALAALVAALAGMTGRSRYGLTMFEHQKWRLRKRRDATVPRRHDVVLICWCLTVGL